VTVTNAGKREGADVVQLYLGFPEAAGEPPKQLKGFEKVLLKPGASKVVTMNLGKDSFAAWDAETHAWKVHPGNYTAMIGSSSRDIRLKSSIAVPSK
jgi:beta-glucosidase